MQNIIQIYKSLTPRSMQSKVFFIENPLLDLSYVQKDDTLLTKYKLQHGQASLATPE